MATVATAKIKADEFLKMELGEGQHELVRGEVVDVPPPGPKHGSISLNVGAIFRDFGRRTGHGHAMSNDSVVVIDEWNVRGADIQYFSNARWPKAQVGNEPPPVPPDVVVEVLSPSERPGKHLQKVADYLTGVVAVVLSLNPERKTLTIYRGDMTDPTVLRETDALEGLPELPGFRCLVSEFFE